ncbi:MAG: ADP-ribosylglycohydrolase family protein [Ruminococcus sp.]|nr:ADP-ribosylglycohydrolase family protein [Ruminococcus sp.]
MAFLDSHDYESAVRNAVSLGGDADTMACIAGGIAEAFYKDIPENIRSFCTSRIDITLKNILNEFSEKYC